jgi:hypothetical protein
LTTRSWVETVVPSSIVCWVKSIRGCSRRSATIQAKAQGEERREGQVSSPAQQRPPTLLLSQAPPALRKISWCGRRAKGRKVGEREGRKKETNDGSLVLDGGDGILDVIFPIVGQRRHLATLRASEVIDGSRSSEKGKELARERDDRGSKANKFPSHAMTEGVPYSQKGFCMSTLAELFLA